MKKKKPQSQRKNIPKSFYQGNNIIKKQKAFINTFRQNKDITSFVNINSNIKNKDFSNKESPRTIDYIQVMNKYSHLIDQNADKSKNNITEEKKNNIYKYNSYYIKTDINHNKNKEIKNTFHYNTNNNTIINTNNNSNTNINTNINENYFNFCQTDYQTNENE